MQIATVNPLQFLKEHDETPFINRHGLEIEVDALNYIRISLPLETDRDLPAYLSTLINLLPKT